MNSRSLFIITHILDPIHLSISSSLIQNDIRIKDQWSDIPKGKICEAMKQEWLTLVVTFSGSFKLIASDTTQTRKKKGYNLVPILFT